MRKYLFALTAIIALILPVSAHVTRRSDRYVVVCNAGPVRTGKHYRNIENLANVSREELDQLISAGRVMSAAPADTKLWLQDAPPKVATDVDLYDIRVRRGEMVVLFMDPETPYSLAEFIFDVKDSMGQTLLTRAQVTGLTYFKLEATRDETLRVMVSMYDLGVIDYRYTVGTVLCGPPKLVPELEPNDIAAQIIEPGTGVRGGLSPNPIPPVLPQLTRDDLSGYQYNLGLMNAYGANEKVPKTEQFVVVLDGGVDYQHPDLAGVVFANPGEIPVNGIDDDSDGAIDNEYGYNVLCKRGGAPWGCANDSMGHGTHIAGIIAARARNGIGIAGVADDVKIIPVRAFDDGGFACLEDILEGMDWILGLQKRGVKVSLVNCSWGSSDYSVNTVLRAAFSRFESQGILSVCAAGNNGSDTDLLEMYPADIELGSIFSVAATDWTGARASFSNYGITTVDFAAPGDRIISTAPGGGYVILSGTSMAAPSASGAIALYLKKHPTALPNGVRAAVGGSVVRTPSLAKTVSGGYIDIGQLLQK